MATALPETQTAIEEQAPPKNRLAARFFFVLIALAPLPFGSSRPSAVAFWCLYLAVTAILCRTGGLNWQRTRILCGIGLLFILYLVVVLLQISSLPSTGAIARLWEETGRLIGGVNPVNTIAREAPFFAIGSVLANLLALTLGIILGSDRRRARQIFLVFAWSGLAYAIYGIGSALIAPGLILWRERPGYYGAVLGTFINRNTAASYFGCCSVIWLLILCETIKRRLPVPFRWNDFSDKILSNAKMDSILSFGAWFICVMALFMTTSRAGVLISLVGIIAAIVIYFRRELPQIGAKFYFVAGAVGVALLLLELLGGSVNQRYDMSGLGDEGRLATYRAVLRMIGDHPWLGTGLGTFVWAFPQYRSGVSIYGVWDMAHSTPLQLAAEMGIPFALVVGAAWVAGLVLLVRGVLIRHRDTVFPLGALIVALIALVHSSVDFPLQIPGYSIVVMALMGTGLAQSFRSVAPD